MKGIWTALPSPFTQTNELDLPAFQYIIQDQIDARVTGIISCGTTGESPGLSQEEKKTLIRTTLEVAKGSGLKVYAGTGSNNTADSIEFSKWASEQGVDGLLIVVPYYNKPTQAGLEQHFLAIAQAVKSDIMLYNVPGRTGVNLAPDTIARLARHPRITALKEASGSVACISEVQDALCLHGQELLILSGDDALFLPSLAVGACGIVSVASNLFPRTMIAMQRAFDQGDHATAHKIHQDYYPLFRDLFIESNPAPLKKILAKLGRCSEHTRLPLAPLTETSWQKLEESLKRCGIMAGKKL